MAGLTVDALGAWVRAQTNAQGLPERLGDVRVLRDVAVLLTGRAVPAHRQVGVVRPAGSEPPHDVHPLRVHLARTVDPASDLDVIDHGVDERSLTGEVQGFPLSA